MRDYLEELLALIEEDEEEQSSPLKPRLAAVEQVPSPRRQETEETGEENGSVPAGEGTPAKTEGKAVPPLEEGRERAWESVTQALPQDPSQALEEQLEELDRAAAVARSIRKDAPSRRRERTAEGETVHLEYGFQGESLAAEGQARLEAGETPAPERRADALSGSLRRLERAGQYRAGQYQAGQYRAALQQQSQSLPSAQETAQQKDGVSGTAQIQARQVDRIFQRDARRYDNRFTLF